MCSIIFPKCRRSKRNSMSARFLETSGRAANYEVVVTTQGWPFPSGKAIATSRHPQPLDARCRNELAGGERLFHNIGSSQRQFSKRPVCRSAGMTGHSFLGRMTSGPGGPLQRKCISSANGMRMFVRGMPAIRCAPSERATFSTSATFARSAGRPVILIIRAFSAIAMMARPRNLFWRIGTCLPWRKHSSFVSDGARRKNSTILRRTRSRSTTSLVSRAMRLRKNSSAQNLISGCARRKIPARRRTTIRGIVIRISPARREGTQRLLRRRRRDESIRSSASLVFRVHRMRGSHRRIPSAANERSWCVSDDQRQTRCGAGHPDSHAASRQLVREGTTFTRAYCMVRSRRGLCSVARDAPHGSASCASIHSSKIKPQSGRPGSGRCPLLDGAAVRRGQPCCDQLG